MVAGLILEQLQPIQNYRNHLQQTFIILASYPYYNEYYYTIEQNEGR